MAAQHNQPIHKTIGINKLGTLLSSQTTDTPSTTQTHVQDRSGATFQTYPIIRITANQRSRRFQVLTTSPAHQAHHEGEPFSGRSEGVFIAIFPHQRRRLRKQYTPTNPTANQPSAVADGSKILAAAGILEATGACRRL
ncbi:hypothetical protein ACFVVC_16055 [Pseudarthrobacter sp. NPDC058196]|uniref:hypothetical protein n=1 Tax=Pseudarthrobacter sp. NPDC058196 TaxID=3346376 RepID=UPI0036DAA75B